MALTIDNPKVAELARELSERTGAPIADVIEKALQRELHHAELTQRRSAPYDSEKLLRSVTQLREVLGIVPGTVDFEEFMKEADGFLYDEHGVPH